MGAIPEGGGMGGGGWVGEKLEFPGQIKKKSCGISRGLSWFLVLECLKSLSFTHPHVLNGQYQAGIELTNFK